MGLVFAAADRTYMGPPAGVESRYAYLERSARPEAETVRARVNKWAADLPAEALSSWLGKFRSTDDEAHFAAFFELFLFQFLEAAGFAVLAIEPALSNSESRPDFLVEHPQHGRMLIEAVAPKSKLTPEVGRVRLTEDVKDAINDLKIDDYYLAVEVHRDPDEALPKRKLKSAVSKWIASKPQKGEKLLYRDRGMELTLTAHPCPPRDVNADSYRAIAIEMGRPYVGTPGDGLREAIRKKAAKYGKPEYPLFIAVNASSFLDSEEDYIAALYGSPQVTFRVGPRGRVGEETLTRANNGVFTEGDRPRKTQVSGVVFFNGIFPWAVDDRRSLAIHNAWTTNPLYDVSFGGDALVPESGELKRVSGLSVGEILTSARL